MILEALGVIFLIFFIVVIVIILIPVIVVLFLYFKVSGNPLTLQKLIQGSKDFFVNLIKRFQNGFQGTKKSQDKTKDSNGNRIEDAEFREIE